MTLPSGSWPAPSGNRPRPIVSSPFKRTAIRVLSRKIPGQTAPLRAAAASSPLASLLVTLSSSGFSIRPTAPFSASSVRVVTARLQRPLLLLSHYDFLRTE